MLAICRVEGVTAYWARCPLPAPKGRFGKCDGTLVGQCVNAPRNTHVEFEWFRPSPDEAKGLPADQLLLRPIERKERFGEALRKSRTGA